MYLALYCAWVNVRLECGSSLPLFFSRQPLGLSPLECAVLDKHLVLPCFSRIRAHATPLECALPRVFIHKLFRMRSSEKSGGRGYSRRSLSPNSFPCHTSENSPVSPIIATLPKTGVSNPCVCHTSETPRGIVQPPQNSQPYPLFSLAGACEPAGSVSLPTLPFNFQLSTVNLLRAVLLRSATSAILESRQ